MKFWSFSNFTLWISEFQLWPKIPLKLVIFPLWTKGFRFKKVFSNLEPEGQGRGIIKGGTRLFLLGPFYTIHINFMYYFAHDCIRKSAYLSTELWRSLRKTSSKISKSWRLLANWSNSWSNGSSNWTHFLDWRIDMSIKGIFICWKRNENLKTFKF